jgi:penicillin V acylase-like amidase (Ntn superfamily)
LFKVLALNFYPGGFMSHGKCSRLGVLCTNLLIFGQLTYAPMALACSTFSYMEQGQAYVGKSYDWDKEQGVLHVNKRGVRKSALQVFPTDNPVTWTSKYGSLTLNQYGRELPNAGINEAGLVVEVMVLGGAKFPAVNDKPSLNESQWVQHMLDMAGSVQDVVALTAESRIAKILIPLHYMACDVSGACVAVEPINGELVVTDLTTSGNKVMTNDTYESGMSYLKDFEGFGGNRPIPTSKGSLDRFVIASDHIKRGNALGTQDAVQFGFDGIERVASSATKWRVVYDLESRRLHFATQSETNIKNVKISDFDFDCRVPVKVYDMSSQSSGDVVGEFIDYSSDNNSQLVRRSLGRSVPEALLHAAESLPEMTECTL